MDIRSSIGTAAIIFWALTAQAQGQLKLAQLKYQGGGDWYANPTSLTNLGTYCNTHLKTDMDPAYDYVEVGSSDLYRYAFIHMTGHGNVVFSPEEARNLRKYLELGGFLHIDDNYGMDAFVRSEMKKVFPDKEWVELPFDHPIYTQPYDYTSGVPKVHEHDGEPARGLALIHEGRVVVFYTVEADLGDGWEDPQVHNDAPEVREKALQMGANLVNYAFLKPPYESGK